VISVFLYHVPKFSEVFRRTSHSKGGVMVTSIQNLCRGDFVLDRNAV
jgi:hypothetical protein